MQTIPTPNGNDNHDKDDYNSGTVSPLDQPSTSNEHLTSFSPQSEQEKTVQKYGLKCYSTNVNPTFDILCHLLSFAFAFIIIFFSRTNLQTILSLLSAKIDDDSPTSNQINVVRDYKGNTHNILRSTVRAFSRQRFNLGARLDVIFVDDTKAAEGAVDGGGPNREYLRLLLKAVQQSRIFEGPENSKRLRLDTEGKHLN